ncbi:MAG: hypothetical protein RLZZ200_801 [Pseudomonadota bacterium]|jgi:tRNA(fMet)-specific endonuclease VapC
MSGRVVDVVLGLVRDQNAVGRCKDDARAKAAMAMAHDVNANLLRKWILLDDRRTRKPEVSHRLQALARQVAMLFPTGRAICEHFAEQFTRRNCANKPISANDLRFASHGLLPVLFDKRLSLLKGLRMNRELRVRMVPQDSPRSAPSLIRQESLVWE